jgi:tetratricopeptide (TPR) repeat protein
MDLGENWALGGVLYLSGRYEEAIDQFVQTLELYPGYQMLALRFLMAGDAGRAVVTASAAEAKEDERWNRFDAVPGYIYARAGDPERARAVLARWKRRAEREWVPKTSLALLELGLGNDVEAARWIKEARRERDPWLVLMKQDPAFGALPRDRSFSRFTATRE